jgi:aspartate/methionine/tyrosine aminotransferase
VSNVSRVVAFTYMYHIRTLRIGLIKYVRSIVNEAAQASPVQPIVNMGQGFFGYNPPQFVLDAAHEALGRVECNQYSPTKV